MKLKTSTKISLKFTLLSVVTIAFFSTLILEGFFNTRFNKQWEILHNDKDYQKPFLLNMFHPEKKMNDNEMRQKWSWEMIPPLFENQNKSFSKKKGPINKVQRMSYEELFDGEYELYPLLKSLMGEKKLFFSKEGEYYLYEIQGETVKYMDITEFFYAQIELIQIIGILALLFILFSYGLSLIFVKTSLKNLKKLTEVSQNLNFDDLSSWITIEGAEHDEIKLIADALNSSLQKINMQILSLKDFIGNSSHELKTPLMMINTEVDLAMKMKDYPERLQTIKKNTKRMANLLEHLSLITRLECEKDFKEQNIELHKVFLIQKQQIENKYPDKTIKFEGDSSILIHTNEFLLSIIIKNLLENACKYAWENAEITFVQGDGYFAVKDTWVGIAKENQKKIFERFWQQEKNEKGEHSFWLGLYLVKKIVDMEKRTLTLESEIGKGSTFTIFITKTKEHENIIDWR